MKKFTLSAPSIILVGVAVTHLFFMLFVYRSNLVLHENTAYLMRAGYLSVPNELIMPSLLEAGSAFKGAFFFTLTIGIVFSTLVYAAAWSWDRGYRRSRPFLIILSGFVIFCMVMINRSGFNPVVTFWFLTVYFLVFKLTLYSLEGVQTRLSPRRLITHVVVFALLGLAWMTIPKGGNLFVMARDHLLLSTSAGEKITSFYYRYSPYATEAIKPISKKQLRTCGIENESERIHVTRITTALIRNDYLPVGDTGTPDVIFRISENGILTCTVNDRMVLRTETAAFLKTPGKALQRVSRRSDRQEFTRRLLGVSILYGIPVILYACLFGVIHFIAGRFFAGDIGFFLSAGICLVLGITCLLMFRMLAPASIPVSELKQALQSENRNLRVAALRSISAESLDPLEFTDGRFIDNHAAIPERLWWAKSLAGSKSGHVHDMLLPFLNDAYPLVRCKAYDALGRKGDRVAMSLIQSNIKTSRHWYVQGYAYQALRSLGWKQTTSP